MLTTIFRRLAPPSAAGLLAVSALAGTGQAPASAATAAPDQAPPPAWAQVSAGGDHTCAVSTGKTLWCWGDNADGQLGIDSTASQDLPQRVGLRAGWSQVSAGTGHTCAIREDGTLWCWGADRSGQLGQGSFRDHLGPVQVGTEADWAQVSAGDQQTCATKADGTLWCWGTDHVGQLGTTGGHDGTRTSPQQVGTATDWRQVSTGTEVTCATRTDGTLWCWGFNIFGAVGIGVLSGVQPVPVQVGTLTTWQQASAGGRYACATRTDGTLWCWGLGDEGQLGIGGTASQFSPVQVGTGHAGTAAGWAGVAAGQQATCALHGEPTLWCWGGSPAGNQLSPARLGPQQFWHQVSVGDSHACGIHGDRTLWCWGGNADGQLGIGSTIGQLSPVQVG